MKAQSSIGAILGGLQEQERHLELAFRQLVERMKTAPQAERIEMTVSLEVLSVAHLRVQDAIAHLVTLLSLPPC